MSCLNRTYPILASEKNCTACFACIDICKKGALTSYMADDGHMYVSLDKHKCIGCKACEKVCISSRSQFGNNNLNESKIFAGWSLDTDERKKATSGGVFTAIAKYVLNNGGVVIGASIDSRECRHILITNVSELEKLQGSKYMASSMLGIYKIIENELPYKTVLFSGLGCQCAGVLAFFDHSIYKKNLITIDLVCGGVPSHILLEKFYNHYPEVETIVSFRSKDKYELKVSKNGNIYSLPEKSLPLHGFSCELTNRFNCYNCQFACAHRKTDLTIGDLWNYGYRSEEHSKGISTIIAHTEKGLYFLNNSNITLDEIRWGQSLKYCKRIVWGKEHIFMPRINLVRNSENMSYDEFFKLYCIAMKPSDLRMELFRAYRYLIVRLNRWKANKYIDSLLAKYEDNYKKI